jgi:hypothetical protein
MKKIKENEQFEMGGQVFSYIMENNSIKLKSQGLVGSGKTKPSFIPPTLQMVKDYFKEKGYTESAAIKFFNSYEAGEPTWHDSNGKPVKAWKQKAVNVWFVDNNKIKAEGTTVIDNFFQK